MESVLLFFVAIQGFYLSQIKQRTPDQGTADVSYAQNPVHEAQNDLSLFTQYLLEPYLTPTLLNLSGSLEHWHVWRIHDSRGSAFL